MRSSTRNEDLALLKFVNNRVNITILKIIVIIRTQYVLSWKERCAKSDEGWMFPSPVTGRCYHASPIQQDYIRPAGQKLGLGNIGWHTFRHTYRSWLDLVGTSMGVQQKLMRHAQIATTMNVYGDAMMESKRTANSKVVQMVLRPALREAK
jgi:integrase